MGERVTGWMVPGSVANFSGRKSTQATVRISGASSVKDIYGKLGLDLLELNGAWELPVPATFVVRDGRLKYRFFDANYLKRQDPAELIAWLKTDAAINRAGAPNG